MGIDIYLRWKEQSADEKRAQYTGFSVTHGHIGYLREAYHGEPYATRILVPEAFAWRDDDESEEEDPLGCPFKASALRERLPATIAACIERQRRLYDEDVTEQDPVCQSYVKFVELAERLESEGKLVHVYASY